MKSHRFSGNDLPTRLQFNVTNLDVPSKKDELVGKI